MLYAVIMAGGAGTRFWPASRAALPKQLLALAGERTMLQETWDRLQGLTPVERILVVTNRALTSRVAQQLPDLPAAAILGEPCKRDTGPCTGLAAAWIARRDPDATLLMLPADHVIRQQAAFRTAVEHAVGLVYADPTRIVTFGIRPDYAAESFGYIQRGAPLPGGSPDLPTFHARSFREKPTAEVARDYLANGDYYWNSGIFVWKAATILDALASREPEMFTHLERIAAAADSDRFPQVLDREFTAIAGKSIDYAVLEHYNNRVVIEAPFDWDDAGSWQAMTRLHGTDDQGNTVIGGRHLGLDSTGCVVHGNPRHLVVTLGVRDCIVVQTPDATLVANKHDEEAVRQVVQQLKDRGWEAYL